MSVILLKNLNFTEMVNGCQPLTESGKEFMDNYRSWLFSNPVSCGVVNSFLNESVKYTFDQNINKLADQVKKYINENNISWQLASACESIKSNNSPYNYISKLGVETVEKLLEMKEQDVVGYIKSGALKSVQYIPEFRNICKQVYKSQITERFNVNYTAVSPVSYVLTDEDKLYFNVGGTNFVISEDKVSLCGQVDNVEYNEINALLESFIREGQDIIYKYKNGRSEMLSFKLNENGMEFKKGQNITEQFNNPASFIDYANTLSKTMPVREKLDFMNRCNAIAKVFENMDHIAILDNVKLITTNSGFTGAVVEAKDNVNLTVFHSLQAGSSSNNYDYMVEALQQVTKLTGLDLSDMYQKRIDEDCKKNQEGRKEIEDTLNNELSEAQINIRKKKIAQLAEAYKNDPVKIALLNNIARDLKQLENK